MTSTLQAHPRGRDVAAVLGAAVGAAEPYTAVRRHLERSGDMLNVGVEQFDLSAIQRVFVLAIGKAALPMARAALDVTGPHVAGGLVVPKAVDLEPTTQLGPLDVLPAGHPVPDARSLLAGRRALELARAATGTDLLLVLLSGGGSALVTWPEGDITLDDMRLLTGLLLRSGATINEVNALRRRCDRVKGGGLLRAAGPAPVAVLVLSDVVGDDLLSIASGPFVLQAAEQMEPRAVVERYGLHADLPDSVRRHLAHAPVDPTVVGDSSARHTIIANVDAAVHGALAEARSRGFQADLLPAQLVGEARDAGVDMAARLVTIPEAGRPFCLVAGGETTVTLRGEGLGGRNQELALAAVEQLAGRDDLLLVALATDGGDGPTDAAGAVVGGATLACGRALGLDPRDFLRRNDAYHYFDALGDLLKPGPTQTNVNDLVLLFAF